VRMMKWPAAKDVSRVREEDPRRPCASGCCTGVPCSLCNVRDDGEALRIPIFSRSMTGCVEQTCANPWWLLLIALRIRQGLVFSARTLPSGKEQVEIRRWCAFSCKQVR
jgi:hypothetical protein